VNPSVPSRNRVTATIVGRDQGRPTRADPAGRPRARSAAPGNRGPRRRAEVEAAGGDHVGRRGRRRPAVGIGQRVLDRKSHVRGAQLGLEGAVHEPDGGVDDALRVDDHLDRVVVDIVQPVGLDDLQALVGERCGVDRDLGAHRPGRVAERLGRVTAASCPASESRNGPARCGQASGSRPRSSIRQRGHCQIAECSESIGRARQAGWRRVTGAVAATGPRGHVRAA
jgi:hypothetical protein